MRKKTEKEEQNNKTVGDKLKINSNSIDPNLTVSNYIKRH